MEELKKYSSVKDISINNTMIPKDTLIFIGNMVDKAQYGKKADVFVDYEKIGTIGSYELDQGLKYKLIKKEL